MDLAKVFKQHLGKYQNVTRTWREWSDKGLNLSKAVRYPMGKGAVPEFSRFGNERLLYVEASKKIYLPLYASLAVKTYAFKQLLAEYAEGSLIVLRDFDGYDSSCSLREMLNDPLKTFGHGFVLALMLEQGYRSPLKV